MNKSDLYPAIGDGVFAKKDIPAYTNVAFFGGKIVTLAEWKEMDLYEPKYWRIFDDDKVKRLPALTGNQPNLALLPDCRDGLALSFIFVLLEDRIQKLAYESLHTKACVLP